MGTITDQGLEDMARFLNGVSPPSPYIYIANGSDATEESTGHTALGAENTLYGSARKAATCSYTALGISTWNAVFYFTGDVTVREYGIFNASSGGRMLYRRVLSTYRNYVDADSMEVFISHSYARA